MFAHMERPWVVWPESAAELEALQQRLAAAAETVSLWVPPAGRQPVIGAVFCAHQRGSPGPGAAGEPIWLGAVLMRGGAVVDRATLRSLTGAEYTPGLLALREGPALEAAARALRSAPDILLVDATGRDHPRGCGLALHLGARLGIPTVGVTDRPLMLKGLDDSKKVRPEQRIELAEQIKASALFWAIGEASVAEIERINIYHASILAMERALAALLQLPHYLLTDAVRIRSFGGEQLPVIKGDAKCATVAAASIVAKVHRDALLVELDRDFPQYGFAEHKGSRRRSIRQRSASTARANTIAATSCACRMHSRCSSSKPLVPRWSKHEFRRRSHRRGRRRRVFRDARLSDSQTQPARPGRRDRPHRARWRHARLRRGQIATRHPLRLGARGRRCAQACPHPRAG